MNDFNVRRSEMLSKVTGLVDSGQIQFSKGSRGAQLYKQLQERIADVKQLSVAQVSGLAATRSAAAARVTARVELFDAMSKIGRVSRGLAPTTPGVVNKFTVVSSGDSKLIDKAKGFAANLVPYREAFVQCEMAPKFIEDLIVKTKALEDAVKAHTLRKNAHAGATDRLNAAMQDAISVLVQLEPIVEIRLENDPLLLSQWQNARRIERRWAKAKPAESIAPAPQSPPQQPVTPAAA